GFERMRAVTKELDVREGGRWLHAMITPDNVARWSLAEFIRIQPKTNFTTRNSFCDEIGNPLDGVTASSVQENNFEAGEGITTLRIVKKMSSFDQLEQFAGG